MRITEVVVQKAAAARARKTGCPPDEPSLESVNGGLRIVPPQDSQPILAGIEVLVEPEMNSQPNGRLHFGVGDVSTPAKMP